MHYSFLTWVFLLFFIVIALEVILLLTLNFWSGVVEIIFPKKEAKKIFCSPSVHKIEQGTMVTHNMLPMSMFLCIKKGNKAVQDCICKRIFKKKHKVFFRVEKHERLSIVKISIRLFPTVDIKQNICVIYIITTVRKRTKVDLR